MRQSSSSPSFIRSIDWVTILMYLLLVFFGWLSICGASYNFETEELLSPGGRPMMQLLWIGLGVLIGFAVLSLNTDIYEVGAPLFYGAMMLLLMVTIVIAPDIKGSRSWLVLGPVRLQPAEFAKVATALTLAWLCNQYEFKIDSIRSYLKIFGIIFFPILLILLQQETGSALVFLALFLALYREGFSGLFMGLSASAAVYFISALVLEDTLWWERTDADFFFVCNAILAFSAALFGVYTHDWRNRWRYLLYGAGIVAGVYLIAGVVNFFVSFNLVYVALTLVLLLVGFFAYLALREYLLRYLLLAVFALGSLGFFFSVNYVFNDILQPHQQVRIKIALGIESDLKGKGYNVDQSKIAIGSGGLTGKGFLKGTQTKLNYVPEQETDFIFCTVGEESGFIGSSALLIAYAIFILRIVALAERQVTKFGRVYGYCVASIFLFHLFINVGMVLGLVPVIGIPLPFFSYGGSSLWGFTFLLFIFLGIDARRKQYTGH
ncbi:cell cycle protein, FtsW/RodA/SpoVE family [Porphyromonas sp. oral taxon 278 str. W7784]|uniref:rod shape-determining protein RodA n=1 Tax=Porphyromonas sp. oral taxon 278 TaxID=712437 RepID=UPI0003AD6839|nr:rod shape-determining protein RodA [Porphyromonas sp. oral taxon 278]ERJ73190.1 cell cycle protein, FtsW/RodA/SpoVE family [Porphyromonas sp. oral taxon 278 str. W7784]